jgi:hypothetical protein
MSVKSVNFTSSYAVQDESDVTLTVIVGDGQFGTSLVNVGTIAFPAGDVTNLSLGKGKDVRNKTLSIKSVVTDTNDKTN